MENLMLFFSSSSDMLLVYTAGLLSSPLYRFGGRLLAMVGHISSFATFLRWSKVARYVTLVVLGVLLVAGLTGCSNTVVRDDGTVATKSDSDPVSGLYCVTELDRVKQTLTTWRDCSFQLVEPKDCLDTMSKLSIATDKYDNCVNQHKADNVIVNPFNRAAL